MISIQTNETINLQLGTAVSVDVVLTYADHTATIFTANGSNTNIATTANTIIVPPPASGVQRQLKFLSVRNRDIITTSMQLKKNVASVEYMLTAPIILKAGESLHYNDHSGFTFYDWNGRSHRGAPVGAQQAGGIYYPQLWSAYATNTVSSNPTGARIINNGGETLATYIGRAPKNTKRVMVKYRLANTTSAVTWGELAVATGTPIIGAGTSLTVLGFNGSNNAIANSYPSGVLVLQGTHACHIDIAPGMTLQEGDDTWILIGNEATTGANLRTCGTADELQTGLCLTTVTRPSLNIGKAVSYSLDGAANLSPYLSVSFT